MNSITNLSTPAELTKLVTDAATTQGVQAQKLLEAGSAKARVALETGVAQAQDAAAKVARAAEDATEFSRGNVEAMTSAVQLYFTGMQDIARLAITNVQSLSQHAIDGAKALTGAKSLKELTDLQSSLACTAFEKSLADANILREQMTKLTEAALAPLTARVTVASEKLRRPLAA